jgi:hypothetical protein
MTNISTATILDTATRTAPGVDASSVITRAAEIISVPKAAPADSFVLHAPLELMARVRLLQFVAGDARAGALMMIDRLGDLYADAGEPVARPQPVAGPPDASRLLAAVAAGDQALVDQLAAAWLPSWSAPQAVGALAEAVVPSLAAAGHAPIGLSLLLRDSAGRAPGSDATLLPTSLLRGALRGLAARPEWRVSWHEGTTTEGDAAQLYRALRDAPRLGRPASDFIHPLMTQAQQPGVADRLLGPVLADRFHVPAALHTVTRVAAWSMLHDDPIQAPYGWSHALTMPQAVLSLAGAGVTARTALAVAATYALGFRVAHGTVGLPDRIEPVAAVASVTEVATAAALHHDAHLVKYVLACLHAAQDDPSFAGLYLSAAARLVEWWQMHG